MSKVKKAFIPAAGLGTRFLPATKAMPKEMLPIIDKPAIHFVVEEAINAGIDDILIITGRGKRAVEDYFDKNYELEDVLAKQGKMSLLKEIQFLPDNVDIHYVRQKEAKGLGHAILKAKKHVDGEPFLVLLGDTLMGYESGHIKEMISLYEKKLASVIAVEEVKPELVNQYGIVGGQEIEKDIYKINTLVEKPPVGQAPSNLAIFGRYLLTSQIFNHLESIKPGYGGEYQLTDALIELNKEQDMYATLIREKRYDIGLKAKYLEACVDYALRRDDLNDFKDYLRNLQIK